MDTVEAGEQRVWVLHAVVVILGYKVDEQVHLLLAHCLDHEALIVGNEEHAARLPRRGQFPQSAAAGWRPSISHADEDRYLVFFNFTQLFVALSEVSSSRQNVSRCNLGSSLGFPPLSISLVILSTSCIQCGELDLCVRDELREDDPQIFK